jgi:hypothetical protein
VTAPDLSFIIPSKWKAGAALVGSALSFVVPYVLQVTDSLPSPWPAVIGVVLFLLSALGVYHAPYAPTGTVLVPDKPNLDQSNGVRVSRGTGAPNVVHDNYHNPWRA